MPGKNERPVDSTAGEGSLLWKLLNIRKKKQKKLDQINKEIHGGNNSSLRINKTS